MLQGILSSKSGIILFPHAAAAGDRKPQRNPSTSRITSNQSASAGAAEQGDRVFVVMPAKAGIQRGVNGRRFLFSWPKPPRRPARVVSRPTPSRGQALRGNDENAIALGWAAVRAHHAEMLISTTKTTRRLRGRNRRESSGLGLPSGTGWMVRWADLVVGPGRAGWPIVMIEKQGAHVDTQQGHTSRGGPPSTGD